MRGYTLNSLNRGMDYSSLIRIHGVKYGVSAVFENLTRTLCCESSEIFVSLFAVVSYIYGNLAVFIVVNALVKGKTEKILNGIKSFAASAYESAVGIAA